LLAVTLKLPIVYAIADPKTTFGPYCARVLMICLFTKLHVHGFGRSLVFGIKSKGNGNVKNEIYAIY
jgi:hypothetical protein